jgi:hypothetical protein
MSSSTDVSVPAAGLDHKGLPSGFEGVVGPSDILEPVGAFGHPAPVRAVILNVLGTTVHLCVCCGSLEDHKRLLFVHKLDVQDVCNVAASLLGVVETELCHDDDATPSAEVKTTACTFPGLMPSNKLKLSNNESSC